MRRAPSSRLTLYRATVPMVFAPSYGQISRKPPLLSWLWLYWKTVFREAPSASKDIPSWVLPPPETSLYSTVVSSVLKVQMPALAEGERSWKPSTRLWSTRAPLVVSSFMPSPASDVSVLWWMRTPVLGVHSPG